MWKNRHEEIIKLFLKELNKSTDTFVLKGGTALKQCYGLDRFSEDIDLDASVKQNIINHVKRFADKYHFVCNITKDTTTEKRCMLHYGNEEHPLKIEASYRATEIRENSTIVKDGIRVYKINTLAGQKSTAYSKRDKIRDLYDLSFIVKNYYADLTDDIKDVITDAVFQKGIEQCDYVIKTQPDPLIDEEKLYNDFLEMYDKLGLIREQKPKAKLVVKHREPDGKGLCR